MRKSNKKPAKSDLVLWAQTASDLMTANPLSIREDATVKEAVAFLIDHGVSAAPVIDKAGRPTGVLSRTDIVVHDREKVDYVANPHEYFERQTLTTDSGEPVPKGFQVENVDGTCVRDIMTPVVFSVTPQTPARKVVEDMPALRVHRLFVVDAQGTLVGVISALDVLRRLRPAPLPDAAGHEPAAARVS
jgi:CBS domain-containing protein